jgi:hypothetical protein
MPVLSVACLNLGEPNDERVDFILRFVGFGRFAPLGSGEDAPHALEPEDISGTSLSVRICGTGICRERGRSGLELTIGEPEGWLRRRGVRGSPRSSRAGRRWFPIWRAYVLGIRSLIVKFDKRLMPGAWHRAWRRLALARLWWGEAADYSCGCLVATRMHSARLPATMCTTRSSARPLRARSVRMARMASAVMAWR